MKSYIIFIFLIIVHISNAQNKDSLSFKNTILIGYSIGYFDNLNSGDFKTDALFKNNKTFNLTYIKNINKKINWGLQFNYIHYNNLLTDLNSKTEYDNFSKQIRNDYSRTFIDIYSLKNKVENYNVLGKLYYQLNQSKSSKINANIGLGFVFQKEKFYIYNGEDADGIKSTFSNSTDFYLHFAYSVGMDFKFTIKNRYFAGLGINYFNLINGPNKTFGWSYNIVDENTLNLNPKNINLNFFIGYAF